MNTMQMLLVTLAAATGILVVTATTVACAIRQLIKKHDRQIFRTYLDDPNNVEAWLVRGAMDQIEQTISLGNPRR